MINNEHFEPAVKLQVSHSLAYNDNNKNFPFHHYNYFRVFVITQILDSQPQPVDG